MGDQLSNCLLTLADCLDGEEGVEEPASEAPPAHARLGRIEHEKERALLCAFEEVCDQFQIPLRLRIEHDKLLAAIRLRRLEVRQESPLRLFHIGEERAGRDKRAPIRQGQRFYGSSAEGAGDQSQRRLSGKLCSRPLSHKSARVPPAIELLSRSEHDFLGLELGQKAG